MDIDHDESQQFIKKRKIDGLLAIMIFYGIAVNPVITLVSTFFLFDLFQYMINSFCNTNIVLSGAYKVNILGLYSLMMFLNSYFNIYLTKSLFDSSIRRYKKFLIGIPMVLCLVDLYLCIQMNDIQLSPELIAGFIAWYFLFFMRTNFLALGYFSLSKQVKEVYIKLPSRKLEIGTSETEIPTEVNRVIQIKENNLALSPIKKRIRKGFDAQIKDLMQKGYNLEDIYDAFLTDEEKYVMSLNTFSQICGELYFGAPRD